MKKLIILLMILSVIAITGCTESKGSFMDFASVKNAERTMIKLTNLMEQYYVENGTYPLSNEAFEDDMRPYFITYNRDNEPVDQWIDMVEEVFVDGVLHYETLDPKITYFITGRAKDSDNTIVFCRPAIPHEESETKE